MTTKKHLILGAGTAGINAIRTLRQLGDQGEIVLVSAEPAYSRMVLPYLLEGRISRSRAITATPAMLERWGVTFRFGPRASALDTAAAKVTLDNGEELSYDNLLIATGSSPVRPDIPGADDPALHTFWSSADAEAVNRAIGPKGHTVAVGAGFIAFTLLNGLMGRSGRLTLVESAPHVLPRMVDAAAAGIITEWLRERGVDIRCGAGLTRISSSEGGHLLEFSEGEPLKADLVLMATGIRPNLGWLEGSGIEINQGIVVDERMRSNVPNVYAAGDVAEGRELVGGGRELHAIEPTAMEHGRVAAASMAGGEPAYGGSLLMNIVEVAGLEVAAFGKWDDEGAEAIVGNAPARGAYRKYLFQGERMTGALLTGRVEELQAENDVGMVKGLIQAGTNLGGWKEFLRNHPFSIKKPFLATGTAAGLLPKTVLGSPSPDPRKRPESPI